MQEKVLIEGLANQIKGLVVGNGHGVLTNKRFIYSKHSLGKTIVMGALVNLTKGSCDYDITKDEIASIEVGKVRLSSCLIITKKNGEVLRYGITKSIDWKIAIDNFWSHEEISDEAVSNTGKNFCPNCGTKLNSDAKFCHGCGNPV